MLNLLKFVTIRRKVRSSSWPYNLSRSGLNYNCPHLTILNLRWAIITLYLHNTHYSLFRYKTKLRTIHSVFSSETGGGRHFIGAHKIQCNNAILLAITTFNTSNCAVLLIFTAFSDSAEYANRVIGLIFYVIRAAD